MRFCEAREGASGSGTKTQRGGCGLPLPSEALPARRGCALGALEAPRARQRVSRADQLPQLFDARGTHAWDGIEVVY